MYTLFLSINDKVDGFEWWCLTISSYTASNAKKNSDELKKNTGITKLIC